MLFTEPAFLFCFLPLLLAAYFLPWRAHRNTLLVAASLLFYAKGGGWFTFMVAGSIVFNYGMAIAIDARRDTAAGRRLLAGTIAVDLLVLAVFKYGAFAVQNANAMGTVLGLRAMPLPRVLLPIGISFFTFHAISYVVDVYRRDARAQKSPVHAALYLLLFPQLIAGPIIRYHDIADQLARRTVRLDTFAAGVRRFIVGLAKKVLIANTVALPADRIFAMAVPELTAGHAWLGVVCYTLQIYFDFSGYSDMAIGLGAMFGFRFPENFRYPYIADSVQDFWRRWHISLSTWFRDYLYVPLGGSRVSRGRTYLNLVVIFALCGLWHGASWNFVTWGLFHGTFLVAERIRAAGGRRGNGVIRHAYVLLVVMVGWVFFRADDLPHALGVLKAMAGAGAGAPTGFAVWWYLDPQTLLAIAAGIVGSTPVLAVAARGFDSARLGRGGASALPIFDAIRSAALIALFTACAVFIAARSYNPFIYFRF